MKDLKIEYADGRLVVLEVDGQSQLHKAVQGIAFSHEKGGKPVLTMTIAEEVTPPSPKPTGDVQEGELLPAQPHDHPQQRRGNRSPRNRRT